MASSGPPDFVARSELLERAYRFAREAHEGERSRGKTRIDHPTAVARLLVLQGADDQVVAAGLLHDVLEDTTVTDRELEDEFGAAIAGLVAALTEDASIDGYEERKVHLREQIAAAGEQAATISLADKLARLRTLEATGRTISPATLKHYRESVALLSGTYPGLPFVAELRHALRNAQLG